MTRPVLAGVRSGRHSLGACRPRFQGRGRAVLQVGGHRQVGRLDDPRRIARTPAAPGRGPGLLVAGGARWPLFSDGLDAFCVLRPTGPGWLADRSGRLYPPAAGRGMQPEGGEAGQVDRSGQQLPVLGYAHQPPHTGTPAAVSAAQQVRQLAFHLRPSRPVIRPPHRIALAGASGGQGGLLGMDADHPTPHAAGAGIPEWADIARGTEPGPPTAAPSSLQPQWESRPTPLGPV